MMASDPQPDDELPRQRKGLNPFLPDAPVRKVFTDESVRGAVGEWMDSERESEDWRDGDTNTYRYRANLLEATLVRWQAVESELVAALARVAEMEDEKREHDLCNGGCVPGDAYRMVGAELSAALARVAAVEGLFSGGPDTECRTSWDDDIECVNVPISSLRAALGDTDKETGR